MYCRNVLNIFSPDIHFKKYIKIYCCQVFKYYGSFKEMYFFLKLTLLLILCCMSVLLSPSGVNFIVFKEKKIIINNIFFVQGNIKGEI